jgi:ADP-ribosyltransferase-like protein
MPPLPTFTGGLNAQDPHMEAIARYVKQQAINQVNYHPEAQAEGRGAPSYIGEQAIEPVPFGAMSDPVSQVAFLGAPGLLRGMKAVGEGLTTPGPTLGNFVGSKSPQFRLGERGNLGPVPRGMKGEPLPESVVREGDKLTRLYHGTTRPYADFELSKSGTGAGGDLYGPGVYLTNSPELAETYAMRTPRMTEVPAPNIRPVYADLKRPFDVEAPADKGLVKKLQGLADEDAWTEGMFKDDGRTLDLATNKDVYRHILKNLGYKEDVNDWLQANGFDGIKYPGGAATRGEPHQAYVVFSPEHVYPGPNVDALMQQK